MVRASKWICHSAVSMLIQWKSFVFFFLYCFHVPSHSVGCAWFNVGPSDCCVCFCVFVYWENMTHCVVNNMHGADRYRPDSSENRTGMGHTLSLSLNASCSIQLFKFISMRIFDLICSVFGQKFNKFYLAFVLFCVFFLLFVLLIFLHINMRIDERVFNTEFVCHCRIFKSNTLFYVTDCSKMPFYLFDFFVCLYAVCFYCSWFKFYYSSVLSFGSQF